LSLHTVLYVMLLSSKATVATTASRISCRCPPRVLRCFSSDDRRVETKVDALGVCYVTLNRPDKLNAVDLAMFEAVAEAASNVRKDRNIRAVILSGTGPAFCTGLDVVRKARCYYIILYYHIIYIRSRLSNESCRMETENLNKRVFFSVHTHKHT
jgi:enoyl-CoA hydratase/carnithine racemase